MNTLRTYYELFGLIYCLKRHGAIKLDTSQLSAMDKIRVMDIIEGIIYGSSVRVSLVRSVDDDIYEIMFRDDQKSKCVEEYKKLLYEEIKYNLQKVEDVYDLIDKMKISKRMICDLSGLEMEERKKCFDMISGAASLLDYELDQLGNLVIECSLRE